MKTYQLYLENILNALTRAGISFPAKLESYEDLWLASESLGVFLEINSLLQRVGSGFSIMGFDESVTFKTYWNTEFYLEYQERKSTELSFSPRLDVSVSEELNTYSTSSEQAEVLVEPVTNFSGITGISSNGFDTYGVTLEEDTDDNSYFIENPHIATTLSQDDTLQENYTSSEITSVSSDGFDIYGVELEEDYEEPSVTEYIEESSTEEVISPSTVEAVVYNEIVGISEDGFDSYGVDLEEDYIEPSSDVQEEPYLETSTSTLPESSSIGFDDYGVDLEEDDEATLNEINGVSTEEGEWVEETETLEEEVVYSDEGASEYVEYIEESVPLVDEPEYIEESVPIEEEDVWVEESVPVDDENVWIEESIPVDEESTSLDDGSEYIEESVPVEEVTAIETTQQDTKIEKTIVRPSYPKQVTDTDKVLDFLGGLEKFVRRKVKK